MKYSELTPATALQYADILSFSRGATSLSSTIKLLAELVGGPVWNMEKWADGDGTEEGAGIQAGFNEIEAAGGGWALFPNYGGGADFGRVWKSNANLTYNPSKVGIMGQGSVLDFSTKAAGVGLTGFMTSATNDHRKQGIRYGLHNLKLRGPGRAVAGHTGFKLGTASTGDIGAEQYIHQLHVDDFALGVTKGHHSYLTVFNACRVNHCGTCVLYPAGLTDGAEKDSWINSMLHDSDQLFDISSNYVHIINCSLDYFINWAIRCRVGAQAWVDHSHIETSHDGDFWLYEDNTSYNHISVKNSMFWIAGSGRTKKIGKQQNATSSFMLDNNFLFLGADNSYTLDELFEGNWIVKNPTVYDMTSVRHQQIWSSGSNILYDGDFEKVTNWYVDWNLGRTQSLNNNPPTIVTTAPHSGAKCLRLGTAASGQVCSIQKVIPIAPGAKCNIRFYLKTNFLNATDALTIQCFYQGASISPDSSLTAYAKTLTYNQANPLAAWTKVFIAPNKNGAPPGASSIRLHIELNNAAGVSEVFMDKVHIEILDNDGPRDIGTVEYQWQPFAIGTTTPGVGTYSQRQGTYYRDGNDMRLEGRFVMSAHTGTGNMRIKLPFKAWNRTSIRYPAEVLAEGLTYTGVLKGYVLSGTDELVLVTMASGANLTPVPMDTACTIEMRVSFPIDAL